MLRIFNNLKLFFEDCYGEIGVREYSRLMKISAPTASKLLKDFESEGLLKKRIDRGYLLFKANRESEILKDLSRIYWKEKLKEVIEYLNEESYNPIIILFGSLAKLESKKNSDIDLVILTKTHKKIDLSKYEKKLGREIQSFFFKSLKDIPENLKLNVINGYILKGELR